MKTKIAPTSVHPSLVKVSLPLLSLLVSGLWFSTPTLAQPGHNPTTKTADVEDLGQETEQMRQVKMYGQERKNFAVRQQLALAGFTDTKMQDAVVAFYQAKETARAALEREWQMLGMPMNEGEVPDLQIQKQIESFQDKVDDEKSRLKTATNDLDVKIGISKNPRLKLQLMKLGIVGEEAAMVRPDDIGNPGGWLSSLFGGFQGLGGF